MVIVPSLWLCLKRLKSVDRLLLLRQSMQDNNKPTLAERVIVTQMMVGICHMQVCCMRDATDDEILDVCNAQNPSGTSCGWASVVREGEDKPVVCQQDEGRLHVLVAC